MTIRNKWTMGFLALGTAALVGVSAPALYSTVYAQADTTEESITDAPANGLPHFGRGFGLGWGMRGGDEEALAEALGITVEELQAAQAEVRAGWLADAVEAGDITQEEADLLSARWALQEFLTERLQTAYEDAVAQAVEEGIITQEQADQILSEEGGNFFGSGMFGPGMDGGHRGGGRHGGPGMFGPGMNGGRWQMPHDAPATPEGETEESSNAPAVPTTDSNL